MPARTGRTIPLALALLALGSTPSIVKAQGYGLNPYGNSGYADYREFTTPSYGNNAALPGQSRLNDEPLITRPRANTYRQYTEDEDGDFESNLARRGSSAGVPYNEAYQQLNKQYNRVYKPNDSAKNDEFVERLKQRDEAFAKALKEKDPVKRARLLRDLDADSATSAMRKGKPKTTTASAAPDPTKTAKGATTSRAPAPPGSSSSTTLTPLSDRRTTAPPPPIGGTRRSTSSTTAPAPPVSGTTRPRTGATSTTTRPAPDPSTIAVPPPR